jgi:monoamine oxidase
MQPKGPNSSIEMGATWFGAKHSSLVQLLDELEIPKFKQFQQGKALFQSMSFTKAQSFYIPEDQSDPSFRIQGGTSRILYSLVERLASNTDIVLNTEVKQLRYSVEREDFTLETSKNRFKASKVILAIPPINALQLLYSIDIISSITLNVLANTHTWMHDSIKFALFTDQAFWREMGFSGTFYSQVGPVVEMYDHCNASEDFFALKGFLSGSMHRFGAKEREQKVMDQLKANLAFFDPSRFTYLDKVWIEDALLNQTATPPLLPHQNKSMCFSCKIFVTCTALLLLIYSVVGANFTSSIIIFVC